MRSILASLTFAAIGYWYNRVVGVASEVHNFDYLYAFTMPLSALCIGLFLWKRLPRIDNWISHFGLSFNNMLFLVAFIAFNMSLLKLVEAAVTEAPSNFSKAVEILAINFGQGILQFLNPMLLPIVIGAVAICAIISKTFMHRARRFQ